MRLGKRAAAAIAAVLVPVSTLGFVGWGAQPAQAAGFPTDTSVSSSANPSAACGPVTFTATVHGALFPDSPEGLVQFLDGTSLLGAPQVITPDFDPDPIFGTHTIPTNHSSASISVTLSGGTHVITAAYAGTDVPSVSDPLFQSVTAATSTTSVTSSVNPSVYGQPVVFRANVTSACTGSVAGTVQFAVDGANLDVPQTIDAGGNASVTTSTLTAGAHPVTAVFTSSSSDVQGSSGSLFLPGQLVAAAHTTTGVASSANPSEYGAPVTFTASTRVTSPGAGTPTGSVQFQADGTDLDVAQALPTSGQTSVSDANLSVGTHAIGATYSSDSANFNGSSGSLSQTVIRARTTLTYTGDRTADFDDPATLSARLTRTDNGAPLAGQPVSFAMAAETCSAVTHADGTASCAVTPSEPAGTYPLTASFAGDGNYQSSSASTSFVVTKEETTTTYTGPTVIAQGSPVTLSGRLLEDGTTPIAGRTLTLTLGSGSSAQSCVTPATDASGNAHCTLAAVGVGQGPQPIRAEFTGDPYYLPSADTSKQAIVFAFPSRGAFLLGDRTAAASSSPVTFWGAQWAKANVTSAGDAPSSFKGFADSVSSSPRSCGATWTSSPGNSSSPVASVPAYMGTLVTSSVGKKESAISGPVTKIVVVVTAPGYGNDPGHAGTGTIVATYCG